MPKNDQIWPEIGISVHFGPNIAIFCTLRPMPDQKPMRTRCLGGSSVMWVTKLLISPVKKGFFAQKQQNLAFLVNLGQAMQAYSMPCWWVGWWLWRGLYLARHIFTLLLLITSSNLLAACKVRSGTWKKCTSLYDHLSTNSNSHHVVNTSRPLCNRFRTTS